MSAPLPLPLGELPAQRIKIVMIAGGNHTKMYEVPPKGAERALSVTAKAVPAPPKGEPGNR